MLVEPAAFSLTPRRRSLVWLLLKAAVAVAVWLPIPIGCAAVWWYGDLVQRTAAPERIDVPVGEIPSAIYSARGFEIGGLERGRRRWVPYAELSPWVVRALVASEDARFFSHHGVDLRGIVRAARANMAAGRTEQGGSTLTQQLAKSFVGDARRLERKLTELVVARRLEATVSKAAIFEAYINRIYFGDGAQGIGAAAELYFAARPEELTLAQAALLTAIVPAPGRFDPRDDPQTARVRRDRVIERMVDAGYATRAEADAALVEPLGVVAEPPERVRAVDVERATWRELAAIDGRDWRYGQLAVHTSFDLDLQARARSALRDALYGLDRRQGVREHLARVVDAERFRAAWAEVFDDDDSVAPGYVTAADGSGLAVWRGEERAVAAEGWSWAVPWRLDAFNHDRRIDTVDDAFARGDVVLVRDDGLAQFPYAEGAYGAVDVADGAIEALVGAFDPDRSQFDRMTQACRQPGSTFKPIVYSVALDQGMTPASLVRDAPIRIDLGPWQEWRPRNADGSFDGHMTLWEAFVFSRNLPALSVYFTVGSRDVVAQARRLGITSPMAQVESLALGASCVAPAEMLEVYATLARGGHRPVPSAVARVTAPGGAEVWVGPADRRPDASPASRVEQMWHARQRASEPVIDVVTAWQMTWLMSEVVRTGTGADLQHWPLRAAGKTGTTNAFDAWFAGFTGRIAAVVWIGSDRNTRPLGRNESGGGLALPAWADAAVADDGYTPLLAEPPARVVWADIDPTSGRRAGEGRWALPMPFRYGTAPRDVARSDDEQDVFNIDRIDREF